MPASTPPRRHSRYTRLFMHGLRRTFVHTFNFALYLLMAVLVLAAGLLVYVLSRDDIPLPGFLIRHIESRLMESGIEVSFSKARIDLHGGVFIQNLRLQPARFGEPVVEAGLVYLDFDELFLAAGMIELSEARAENIVVSCPSALSPSGSPFPLVHVNGLAIERAGRAWSIRGVVAEAGTLRITAHGTVTPPPSREPRVKISPIELINHFAEYAPKIARAMRPLEDFEAPRVDLEFDVSRNGEIRVSLNGSASVWSRAGLGEAHEIRAGSTIIVSGGRIAPFDVKVSSASVITQDIRVDGVGALVHWDALASATFSAPAQVLASATRIVHPKATIADVSAAIDTHAYPQLSGELSVRVTEETVEAAFSGNAATRSGEIEARGRFARDWLQEASRVLGRDVTYYATISEPPDFWGHAWIGEGGKWQQAEFRALAGPIIARGVSLDRARVHGTIVPGRVDIDHLEIAKADQHALGTYVDQFTTRDHRLVLHGTMRPLNISGWFGGWWPRFWNDFTFDGPPPTFDIDVSGNWNIRGSDIVLGRGRSTNGAMRGIRYDSFDTRFHIRSNYYDLYEATVLRPEGWLAGEVQLQFRPNQRDAARTRFDFESTADLVELARIFGKGGEALLEPYRYTVPPKTHVSGEVLNDQGKFDTSLKVKIESPAEFRYYDFPVASIVTDVTIHNTHVEIPQLLAGYAGGTLRASATADAGILTVKASIDDASYDDATRIFNEFLDRKSPPPPEERDPAGLAARPPGGRLNLGIDARGPITTFDAYEGTGSLRISDANLGSVKIFGVMSDLLGTINPKLGSLSFNEANSTFVVRRDRVAFPDLRVTGRTAALQTEGTYYVNSKNLDFRARLYPLGESGGAITQLFELVLDPFSFLLEMRLTGTLRKPSWSLSRMPFAAKPVIDEGTPMLTPSAPAPPPEGIDAPANPEPAPESTAPDAADPAAPVPGDAVAPNAAPAVAAGV